jgi:CRP/FNR family transcriptional regulator, cyclic AMP receptor protein
MRRRASGFTSDKDNTKYDDRSIDYDDWSSYGRDVAADLHVLFADGRRLTVRRAHEGDRAAIVDLYEHLTPTSRSARFHHPTPRLTGYLREFLTDLREVEVWLAFDGETCVGESRIAPYSEQDRADLAVTVADEYQGNGLAHHLVRIAVAQRRDVDRPLTVSIRPDNAAAVRLFRRLGVALTFDGGVLEGRITRPPRFEEITTMPKHDPKIDRLAEIKLFRGCTTRQLRELAKLTTEMHVAQGAVLWKEGDAGRECFVLSEGHASVTIGDDVVAMIGPGDLVGELALLDGQPRVATVTALSDLHVVTLSAREFNELLARLPVVARRILKLVGDRLRVADAELHQLRLSA